MDPGIAVKKIKTKALGLGFFSCGIAEASALHDHEPRLKKWIRQGKHAEMSYMENHMEMRLNPAKLVEGARSVIVLLHNYYPSRSLPPGNDYLISRYAYGTDYHFVIRDKLKVLQDYIQKEIGTNTSRVFTDSAPVLERAWAVKAGLGWIGKNAMLITPRNGSYFFIAEIITSLSLAYDNPSGGDYCGDCSRCIDACPTRAIEADRVVDAKRCISYLTIEKKGALPEEFKGKYRQWIFGCDICQEVCPWNRYSDPHREPAFDLPAAVENMTGAEWENHSPEEFNRIFRKSALKRAKFDGIKRNIAFLKHL